LDPANRLYVQEVLTIDAKKSRWIYQLVQFIQRLLITDQLIATRGVHEDELFFVKEGDLGFQHWDHAVSLHTQKTLLVLPLIMTPRFQQRLHLFRHMLTGIKRSKLRERCGQFFFIYWLEEIVDTVQFKCTDGIDIISCRENQRTLHMA